MVFTLVGKKKNKYGENRLVFGEGYTNIKEEIIAESNHVISTIYLDRDVKKYRVCPCCEAETDKSNTYCHICGRKI